MDNVGFIIDTTRTSGDQKTLIKFVKGDSKLNLDSMFGADVWCRYIVA